MFLVKHIHPSGSEDLYQTPSVRYSPGFDRATHGEPTNVWVVEAEHEIPLTGGTVFVMNDNGKTVARYNLGAIGYTSTEQGSFAEFSREKDGGLAAEAVETLRRPQRRSGGADMAAE